MILKMETGYIVAISVISGVFSLLLGLYLVFKSIRRKLEKYIQDRFDMNKIIGATTKANFFGLKSKGAKQIRGNGAIVLTRDQLFFIRALPFKEYKIPIKAINSVSMPKSFNGKSVFTELLCVHYNVDGIEDSIAWAVDNPVKWKESIENRVWQFQND
jgi:hypothetical protein